MAKWALTAEENFRMRKVHHLSGICRGTAVCKALLSLGPGRKCSLGILTKHRKTKKKGQEKAAAQHSAAEVRNLQLDLKMKALLGEGRQVCSQDALASLPAHLCL